VGRVADISAKAIWVAVGLYAFLLPWGVSGAEIALGIGVLAWLVKTVAERKARWVGRPVGRPVLLFVLLFFLACVVGWVYAETMRELLSLRALLAIFLVATNLRDRVGLRRVALVLVGSLALLSLYAASSRLVMVAKRKAMHVPLVVSSSQLERLEREGRLEGAGFWLPDLGSMSEAGQLAMGLPIALALLLAERNRKLRIALIVALVLLGANLILNMKRGAWIACLAALLVFALVEKRRVVLLILVLFIVAGALVPAVRNRVYQAIAGDDGERLELWACVPRVVVRWPLGVGPGCSYHVLRSTKPPNELVPRAVYEALPDKVHFHSTFAELAVAAGPLTVGAFVWWFVAFGVWCVRRLRRMPSDSTARPIVLGGLLAAVAFFVNGVFEYNLGDSDVTLMVYLAMGMAMAAVPTTRGLSAAPSAGKAAM
jgi:hypothetical protein